MKKPRYLKAAVLEKIGRPLKIINAFEKVFL